MNGATLPMSDIVQALLYLVVVLVAAFGVGGWIADRCAGDDRLDRALAWTVGSIAHPLAVALALGSVGQLTRWRVCALSAVTGAPALVAWVRHRRAAHAPRPIDLSLLAVVGVAAFVGAGALLVGFNRGPTLHNDSKYYHYAAIEHFVDHGTIWTLPYQNPAFFTNTHPANAELLGAVVAFSTAGDHLVLGWLLPVSGLLTVLASAALAREIGGRARAGALGGLAFVAAPFVFGIVGHGLANDLFAVAGVLAAIALLLRARREASTAPVWLAGAALGIGVGTKYTVLVPAVVIVLVAAFALRPLRRAAMVVPGLAVFAGLWFVRNAINTGNPLYPQPIRAGGSEVFGGGSGLLDQYSGTLGGHILHGHTSVLSTWLDLARPVYGPLLLAAPIGVGLGLWLGIRRSNRALVWLSAFGALALVAYVATPFTGTGDPPLEFLVGSNLRYLMLALVVGVIVLSSAVRPPIDLVVAGALMAWSGWELVRNPLRRDVRLTPAIVGVSLLIGVAVLLVSYAPKAVSPLRASRVLVGLAVTVALGIALTYTLVEPRRTLTSTPLEAAVTRAAGHQQAVAVFGVSDLRSVIGGSFAHDPVTITPNDHTPLDVQQVNAKLEQSGARLLVVGSNIAIPADYRPPSDWCQVADVSDVKVYKRVPAGTNCN